MKCKIGDLAMIIASDFPENIGGLVDVIEAGTSVGEWGVKTLQPLTANDTLRNELVRVPAGAMCGIQDYALQPIRGPRNAAAVADEIVEAVPA